MEKDFTPYEIKAFSLIYHKYKKFGYKIKSIYFKEKLKSFLSLLPFLLKKLHFNKKIFL